MEDQPMNAKEILLDLDVSDAQARKDQSGEAYQQVSSASDFRLGVVVSVSPDGELVHAIELLVSIFPGQTELRLTLMERAMQLIRELKDRGYRLVHEEDGWVSSCRTLARSEVAGECEALMDIVLAYRADRRKIETGTGR